MRKLFSILTFSFAGALALGAGACSSSGGGSDGGGNNGGASCTAPGCVLVPPDMNGYIDGTNQFGILGAWYSYGDSYTNPPRTGGMCASSATPSTCGDCQAANFADSACSMITTPVPGQPFANTDGKMQTSGTVAQVVMMAYSAIWGAGIGFDLQNAGNADGGTGGKLPYDATSHGALGIAFDISGLPIGGQMRVEFPTTSQHATDAAYWGGASGNLSPMMKDGHYEIHWTDVGGPKYLVDQGMTPPAFDATKILSVQFHVVSNTTSTIPYNFTVSNFGVLTK